jgi:hypothetical protein
MPLGEYFPECAILDSRGSRLPRGALPRILFPESCTRGRLPRVQLALPRVQSCSGGATLIKDFYSKLFPTVPRLLSAYL